MSRYFNETQISASCIEVVTLIQRDTHECLVYGKCNATSVGHNEVPREWRIQRYFHRTQMSASCIENGIDCLFVCLFVCLFEGA